MSVSPEYAGKADDGQEATKHVGGGLGGGPHGAGEENRTCGVPDTWDEMGTARPAPLAVTHCLPGSSPALSARLPGALAGSLTRFSGSLISGSTLALELPTPAWHRPVAIPPCSPITGCPRDNLQAVPRAPPTDALRRRWDRLKTPPGVLPGEWLRPKTCRRTEAASAAAVAVSSPRQ